MRVLTKEEYDFLASLDKGCKGGHVRGTVNRPYANMGTQLKEREYVTLSECPQGDSLHYYKTGLGKEAMRAYEAYNLMAELFV